MPRLDKLLADRTTLGRKLARTRVRQGRVRLGDADGSTEAPSRDPGLSVPEDTWLYLDRQPLPPRPQLAVLYKPVGVVSTTSDPHGRACLADVARDLLDLGLHPVGRLDADNFLGGSMALDEGAAEKVIDGLAERLGIERFEAAEGVLTIMNSNMANAIRAKTVQKGIDPRGFSLVAFGGAGPLHGAEVADLLGIPEVVVPLHPGITSAAGLLTTDLKYDQIKTEFQVKGNVDLDKINRDFEALSSELLEQFASDGLSEEEVEQLRFGDLRYVGQGYELRVPIGDGPVDAAMLARLWQDFHAAHAREYGHAFADSPIELVNVRLVGTATLPKLEALSAPEGGSLDAALVRTKPSIFRTDAGLQTFETPVYRRDRLPVSKPFDGPAILLQTDSTTVVPPGAVAEIHPSGSILMRLGETQ